ncbi:PIG-L deacetylase family protein [Deinococcus peraridilitoris]|uniref:Putative LmbE-like protein n=1 Tax=Deinococcus peraridilitoris (strain DSM 19664 / LMG 22246 / CIP 109416 / KR-200) TaxID=937777 RepID=K9ZXC1_DEIPD|nr:PIG-L family deacetylase [Deinococcus peraridilitoris]AFZ66216.1 putative LmbE-like protein [Deinococcus peraridilitoris DSM 19664]
MKLLLIVPHPDDEVYGAGGTILEWTGEGHRVGLLTLTRGEKGRTLGLAASPEELATLRAAELRACLDVLGVQDHQQLAYPDGGLKNVLLEELALTVQNAVRRFRPQIVLTFPPNGSNGHPDHVATSAAVRAAWKVMESQGEALPELWFYAGVPPEDPQLLASYLAPNIERDVSAFTALKLRAMACHRSQALSTVDWLRRFSERVPRETFHRASSQSWQGERRA